MIWLQLSANIGPAECCVAVTLALARLHEEAEASGISVRVVELQDGPLKGTYASALLELDDERAGTLAAFTRRWTGSLLWVCPSPYRKQHKRKNWFISATAFDPPRVPDGAGEIRYEAMRASGPGGQMLAAKLQAQGEAQAGQAKSARHLLHRQAERGNAARVFSGLAFVEG
ncbi:MAG: peptide chain release factor H [Gammaproteobacteria bacterium]